MSLRDKLLETNRILRETLSDKSKKIALSFSHQSEDVVVLDLVKNMGVDFSVFTLDTHKLFDESKAYESEIENHFGIVIENFSAPRQDIDMLEERLGEYGIYESIEARKECCRVRKLIPLGLALYGKDIWLTGLRADQSVTRANNEAVEFDAQFGIFKVSPILAWNKLDIEEYLSMRGIPVNELYSKGYTSIGCKPCTRAILEGESERAGRWWWEDPEHKECGLHRR